VGFIRQDIRYAIRALGKNRLFTLAAVLSLAVGIAANTTVFSVVNALFMRPLAGINDASGLVEIGRAGNGTTFDNFSYPNFADYRERNTTFTGMAAWTPIEVGLETVAGASHVAAHVVTGNYFDVLGIDPASGRFFLPEEDETPGTHPVTVISHRMWEQGFDRDPAVIGGTVRINGRPFTLVGVAPEGFLGTLNMMVGDVWIPVMMREWAEPGRDNILDRRANWLQGIGRLRPEVSRDQPQADPDRISAALVADFPEIRPGTGVQVVRADGIIADFDGVVAGFMALLMVLVGLVLLVACVNLAGAVLSSGMKRQREIAVRMALGATRRRVTTQLLTENLLLSLGGGTLGLVLSAWTVDSVRVMQASLPIPAFVHLDIPLDFRVFLFALAISLLSALLFGLLPSLRASKVSLIAALKNLPASAGHRGARMRQVLVAGQLALSLILLVSAGLLLRALSAAGSVDTGIVTEGVHVAQIDLSKHGYSEEQGSDFYRRLLERIRAVPDALSASLAADLPLDGAALGLGGVASTPDPGAYSDADFNVVFPGYFQTLGIPLVAGEDFSPLMDESGSRVARNGKYGSIDEGPVNFVYVPFSQNYHAGMSLLVRSRTGTANAAETIRSSVRELDATLPITGLQPLSDYVGFTLLPQRIAGNVAGTMGLLVLLLSAMGVYGVVALSVTERTREIGVRMALGAKSSDVFRQVVVNGMKMTLGGVFVGGLLAAGLTEFLASLLYGVTSRDPLTFGASGTLLVLITLAASIPPAWRAVRISPIEA
jgi:predicted permease